MSKVTTDDFEIPIEKSVLKPNEGMTIDGPKEFTLKDIWNGLVAITATLERIADSLEVISGALCQQYIEAAETDPPKVKKPKKVKKGKKK